jgi:hypothetical protein
VFFSFRLCEKSCLHKGENGRKIIIDADKQHQGRLENTIRPKKKNISRRLFFLVLDLNSNLMFSFVLFVNKLIVLAIQKYIVLP